MRMRAQGLSGSAVYLLNDMVRVKHGGTKIDIRIQDISSVGFKPAGLFGGYIEFSNSDYRRPGRVNFTILHNLGFLILKNEVESRMIGSSDEPKVYKGGPITAWMKKARAERKAAKKAVKNNVEDHL